MDKETYKQLDRIEVKENKIIEGIRLLLNMDTKDIIIDFLEKEVYNKKGKLNHLKNDEKIKQIFDDLYEEEKEIVNDEEEYTQDGEIN